MKNIKTFLTAGWLLGILAVVSPVAAQSPSLNKDKLRNQWPGNCQEAQAMTANRIRAYKNHRGDYIARYEQIIQRGKNLVTVLKVKNYDNNLVTQLETDLIELKTKIQNFGADADAAIIKLEEANDFRCGKSEGEYAGRIRQAKELLAKVRADAGDVRNFVTVVIKEDLKALRQPHP